ncbi:putative lysine-specific permease [Linnemannia elongata AG-77]|uniref:Putative lysine-specific permease n=1 Tax=Linnemannia elongata AG-77 TaxID=1314771 RepID=A0A197JU43_9FUNG|nr:putative lysine-specific permease [Linnemannia elongata AG-77]
MTATSYSEKPEYTDTGSIIDDDKAIHRSGGPNENEQFGEVKRGLKSRHVQMIAIGGTIGTSVFLSAGASVASAGPLGGLISYLIVGTMVFFIVTSLGEMAAYLPLPGAFTTFGARFVDPALGFGLGFGYAFQWIISVTIEVTSAGLILQYWWPNLQMWIPALIFIVLLVGMALLGVSVFGELEYWLSMIKVITCVIFILVGILVDVGAVGDEFIGGRNWHIEGAPIVGETAKDKTVNIFTTCIWAFFSFGGTELVGITAGESANPGKAIPKAIRHTFWRIMLFFILSVMVIGLVIPWTDENLLGSAFAEVNQAAPMAPFTIIFKMAKLPGADHAVNAILLSSVLSAGQSAYYASTRTLMAMGREGKMPAIFGRVNSRGVPLYSLALVTLVACVAFVADVVGTGVVFTWLVNLTGMSALLTWLSISVVHLRFRAAYKAQGRSIKDLPYIAPFFPYSCYISILLALMIAFLEGYQAVTADPFVVEDVIAVFAGAPVFFFSIIGWKIYHKTKLVPLLEVDLDTGRPTIVQGISVDRGEDEEDEDKEREAKLPRWKRAGLKILRFIA